MKPKVYFTNIILLFFFAHLVQAQELAYLGSGHEHEHKPVHTEIIISFGEKLPIEKELEYYDLIRWKVTNADASFVKEGVGASLSDLVFDVPGTYTITTNVSEIVTTKFAHTCVHPRFSDTYTLKVSRARFNFDEAAFSLSSPIIGGQDASNVVFSIPVMVATYLNIPYNNTNMQLEATGIECTIKGKILPSASSLHSGKNVLQFQLSGTAKSGTYIQFDITTPDGQIYSFGYTSPIK